MGLDVDLAFMDRPDWQKPGPAAGRRFQIFCPLSAVTEKRRVSKSKLSSQVLPDGPSGDLVGEESALAQQYDLELHQMVAYMRRLDGAYAPSPQGEKCMDPFAPDGESKWAVVNGSKIPPLFGFWAYYAWEHVLGVVFSSSFGPIFTVSDARGLKELMAAEVMM